MAAPDPHPSLPPLEWVKPPLQARSQRTLERILDAAEEFIREHGVQALTVSGVVSRARSSVGSFYSRFPDKTALLRTLHERECMQALATSDAALDPARWRDVPLNEAFEQVVRFTVDLFVERRALVLAFMSVAANDPSFAERRARVHAEIATRLHRFLEARADEIPHPDLKMASEIAVRLIFGTLEIDASLGSAVPAERALSKVRLAVELTRALLGYLGIAVSLRVPRREGP